MVHDPPSKVTRKIRRNVLVTSSTLILAMAMILIPLPIGAAYSEFHGKWQDNFSPENISTDPVINISLIFGTDDRRRFKNNEERKWLDSVGLIRCRGKRRGTAFVVGTKANKFDVVLTAGHVFLNKNGKRRTGCRFYPRGRGKGIILNHIKTGFRDPLFARYSMKERANDWGVAILEKKISPLHGRMMAWVLPEEEIEKVKNEGARFLLVGFNGSNRKVMVSDNCGPFKPRLIDRYFSLGRDPNRILLHDCDTVKGWSGGPLVMIYDGKYYAVAVHSYSSKTDVDSPNPKYHPSGAVRITTQLYEKVIEAMARGDKPMLNIR